MGIRCFIAIELPEWVKATIEETARTLKKLGGDVKWVRPENMHMTLKFLGDTPEDKVDAIKSALISRASGFGPIEINIRGTGAFPSLKRPSVLWAGIEFPPEFKELQKAIETDMATLGFEPEGRPFKPHLTLARIRRGSKAPGALMDRFAEFRELDAGSFVASEVCLIQSRLTPTGPVYAPLARAPLSAPLNRE